MAFPDEMLCMAAAFICPLKLSVVDPLTKPQAFTTLCVTTEPPNISPAIKKIVAKISRMDLFIFSSKNRFALTKILFS